MKKYRYKGVIESEEELNSVIEKIFDDESEFAFQMGERVVFKKIKDVKVPASEEELRENNVLNFIKVGMGLVELFWEYHGDSYRSLAVVSDDDGIVYDNIGTRVPMSPELLCSSADSLNYGDLDVADTLAEGTDTLGVVTREFSISESQMALGGNMYSFSIKVSSAFDEASILVSKDIECHTHAAFGFKCVADAKTEHGTLFQDKYHEFSWAYGYGNSISFSIKSEDVGFSISGGGTTAKGTEVHTRKDGGN